MMMIVVVACRFKQYIEFVFCLHVGYTCQQEYTFYSSFCTIFFRFAIFFVFEIKGKSVDCFLIDVEKCSSSMHSLDDHIIRAAGLNSFFSHEFYLYM